MRVIYILFLAYFLNSCIPGENPVQPYDRGGMISSSVSLGKDYSEQVYFSLESNSIIASNKLTDWDIGFACQENNFVIIMNYGKFMKVFELDSMDFQSIDKDYVKTLPDSLWRYDDSEGDLDSTAVGKWWSADTLNHEIVSKGKIYIIDRGFDENSKKQGQVKFRIDRFDDDTYYVTFADLKQNIEYSVSIRKDPLYNYTQLLFDETGGIPKQLEPPRENWDLLFTSYTELLYQDDFSLWYGVTGAYLNPNKLAAAYLESDDFLSVDATVIDTVQFSTDRNKIGHDWKFYDLQNGSYLVFSEQVYIINSVSGFFYKLHFTDFYDVNGVVGTPNFEFQKL